MSKGALLTGAAVFVGFVVGFGVGQKTRKAAQSNVTTEYDGGKVVIVADVSSALKTGVADYVQSLTKLGEIRARLLFITVLLWAVSY